MGLRYRRMKDQKQGPGLARNKDFAVGGGGGGADLINQKLKYFKNCLNREVWRAN